jgi:hypothetical protein
MMNLRLIRSELSLVKKLISMIKTNDWKRYNKLLNCLFLFPHKS